MTPKEKTIRSHAVDLGNSGEPGAVPELIELLRYQHAQVRRLAASALGKLSSVAYPAAVVPALINNLQAPHPQVRQYLIRALSAYGVAAKSALHDLADIANNAREKDYNISDAQKAVEHISEMVRIVEQNTIHVCQRCGIQICADEYHQSMKAFDREYCNNCFDEIYIKRRNWDTKVELHKNIQTTNGTLVQSDGERIIAEYLSWHSINYRYDERMRIIDGCAIRPDFYLPEFDLYIEYWGMDTTEYKIGMLKKLKLYQDQGKKLVSLSYKDKPYLEQALHQKLSRYMRLD